MQHSAGTMVIDQGYLSIYATPDGETHLRAVGVRLESADFAPPAQPLLIGEAESATNCFFLAFPCGWGESDLAAGTWHPTPRRQFCTVLRGEITGHTSDGSSVQVGPGDSVLLEDVAPAKGHIVVNRSTEQPCLLHIVQLAD